MAFFGVIAVFSWAAVSGCNAVDENEYLSLLQTKAKVIEMQSSAEGATPSSAQACSSGHAWLNRCDHTGWATGTACPLGYKDHATCPVIGQQETGCCAASACVGTTNTGDDGTNGNFYCINGGTIGGTTGSCTCSCNADYSGASCETAPVWVQTDFGATSCPDDCAIGKEEDCRTLAGTTTTTVKNEDGSTGPNNQGFGGTYAMGNVQNGCVYQNNHWIYWNVNPNPSQGSFAHGLTSLMCKCATLPTEAPTPAPTAAPTPAPTAAPTEATTTRTTTVVNVDDLDDDEKESEPCGDVDDMEDEEKEIECDDKQTGLKECQRWCYSKTHRDKPWIGKKCDWFSCALCTECTTVTTTIVNLDGLEDDEKEIEIDDEQNGRKECQRWCYSKKHKNEPWIGQKCDWFSCATCTECHGLGSEAMP